MTEHKKTYTDKLIDFINASEVSSDLKSASIALIKMYRTKCVEEYKVEKELQSNQVVETLNYGKYKNRTIAEVVVFDRPYLLWLVKQSFVSSNIPLLTAVNKALSSSSTFNSDNQNEKKADESANKVNESANKENESATKVATKEQQKQREPKRRR